uniref:Uncharacterized protein n=1 Tax=Spongospora subterranea TaxID=70186 RepID=A0A0H5QVJ4_9EUKA|eukprot:CRZ05621.1 hypothetical protein [Spongospora subterranea]
MLGPPNEFNYKAYRRQVLATVTEEAVAIVAFLSRSSSKYLVKVQEAMQHLYGRSWAIISVCDTRWNSLQMCIASLLRARTAFRSMAIDEVDLPNALLPLTDPFFWSNLVKVEALIRPICSMFWRERRRHSRMCCIQLQSFIRTL